MFSFIKVVILSLLNDIYTFRSKIFLTFSNILPDLVFISYLRPIFLRLAGVNIPIFGFTSIKKGVIIEHPKNLIIGKNVNINRGVVLAAHANIIIGDNVSIAFNSAIITISHKGSKHEIDIFESIKIAQGCHIGTNSIIMPGSKINEQTIISPGCVFSGESLKKHIYVGNPARKIKERDDL